MILTWLVIIPLVGGMLAWLSGRKGAAWSRWISLGALALEMLLLLTLTAEHFALRGSPGNSPWLAEFNRGWIPAIGIGFHLALDGLSLLLILLTVSLGIISVVCSWTEINERVGFFHFNLLSILAGIIGVFLAIDLFLFYFFWELMLVPMYFLIALWGHENRIYASVKFFIFTQLGGLLMLISILGLYFIHGRNTGVYTFDYMQLLGTSLTPAASLWLMLGFFIAFAVKLPVVPFHSWLPDAHTEAPTAGSVILAGLLLKTGAYGMLRFMVPFFPNSVVNFGSVGMTLAVIGILYGAILAFAQTDLKRLVAYTSVSHMGFVLLGISAGNTLALQGVVMQMLCHGISTGALFILVGSLQERLRTRDMKNMGGLWSGLPRMGGMALVFALASLGLPGLGNFVGEFLVLLGSFRSSVTLTALATIGLVFAAIYSLWIIQRVFHGERREERSVTDLSNREMSILMVMAVAIFMLGLYPQPIFRTAGPAVNKVRYAVTIEREKIEEGKSDGPSIGQGVNNGND